MTRRGFLKSLVALAASRAVPIPRHELRLAASTGLAIPIGTIFYAVDAHGATVHLMKTDHGFVELVGGVLSRKHYPALFDAIGTTWGEGQGDGETFTLPDLRAHPGMPVLVDYQSKEL